MSTRDTILETNRALAPRAGYVLDIFTTALEGGINYWAAVDEYHWEKLIDTEDGELQIEDLDGFFATIYDDDDKQHTIDRRVISRGLRMGALEPMRSRISWSTEAPPLVITSDTDWDFDASDADIIVQLGLFGEVVYG